ncbi:MAG: plastocyanin/azurin family copper-binding protein [Limisphaerales bacterium]
MASLSVVTVMVLLITGCGRKGESSGGGSQDRPSIVTVHLTANDQIEYDKTTFTVPAGATVKLIFQNVGTLPITIMGHDVVILKKSEDVMKFGGELMSHGANSANNFLPASMRDRVLAHTDLIGGGQTTSITFTAPPAGTYPYLCTFPGHFVSMHGTMIVQ